MRESLTRSGFFLSPEVIETDYVREVQILLLTTGNKVTKLRAS